MTDFTDRQFEASQGSSGHGAPNTGLLHSFLIQLLALVGTGLFAAVFLTETRNGKVELRSGVAPLLLQFVPLWGVLLGGLWWSQKRRGVIASERKVSILPNDLLWVFVGIAAQFVGALIYLPFNVSKEDLSGPANDLFDRFDGLGLGFFALAICVGIFAPIVEELFYRGLVMRSIQRAFRSKVPASTETVSIAVSSILGAIWFGAIHFQPLQFPALALVGLICGLAMFRTGRIAPAIFVHMGFNLTTVVSLGFQIRGN